MGKVNHVGFIVGGSKEYMQEKGATIEEAYSTKFDNVQRIVTSCVRGNVPIMTFLLLPQEIRSHNQYPLVVDSIVRFIDELRAWPLLSERQVKVSVLGHWYNLPGRLVDSIKAVMDQTKEYDSFFLNLCLNYDGKQELVDATKLIAQQVKAGKLDPDVITTENMKEHIYTSALVPPDIIIKTGASRKLQGFLLWDGANADIHITGRPWQSFTEQELDLIIKEYSRSEAQ
jgi:undecaprenyl diphosphate synthase